MTRPKRNWSQAIEKVAAEGNCRSCGARFAELEAAHIIARSQVVAGPGEHPDNIVPLCRPCHTAYDGHTLELLPFLTLREQSYAAGLVGIARAYRITTHRERAARAATGANEA